MRYKRYSKKPQKMGKYKSKFEATVAALLPTAEYESREAKVHYRMSRVYQPDFTFTGKEWLLIETKGFFREGDAAKYKAIAETPGVELVFLFSNPEKKYGQVRKDGSYMTYRDWCNRYGILCYSVQNVPEVLCSGEVTKEWIQIEKQKIPKTPKGIRESLSSDAQLE